jgi:Nitroreductase
MELQEALQQRRSIRKYQKKDVSKEDIQAMIEAANLAPSWKNSQVIRYYVVQTPDTLNQIKQTLPEFNYNNVVDAPVLIVSCIVINRSGYERNGEASNEIGNGWGCYDCGLHDMNLILKATELGLSTLIMGIRDAKRIKEILNIDDNQMVLSVIAVGYGDIQPQMPQRKSVDEMTKYY